MAETVSEIIRAAYSSGDLLPGLPTADGALADSAELFHDLSAGQLLWVAQVSGEIVGTVRAVRNAPDSWEVRRLAVSPSSRHSGTARRLLRRLEADALAAGASRVVLDAVVERGNPAFYARVGYRTVRHFPAGDKPLSEVRMERDLREAPAPVPHDAPPARPGLLLDWLAVPTGTVCRLRLISGEGVPDAGCHRTPLGADFWPAAGPAELARVRDALAEEADQVGRDELFFGRPATGIAAFCGPRLLHPALLAWWRSTAVRQQPVRQRPVRPS
ncbi:GNAT family N-acetyltransferase [Streptomyces sp. NBC_01142]|uniref:GNAT family N-acetyltransferase n=1 Tax=Streptomyces sp. NBC_01142 TaxID=2975865 RepID=UPI00224DFC4E|nr:GNAT family N-acetyltransferase [Streptomyces sp. NBC_01142]MCX4820769.1 GNAT family N-acetyltransferase [Streptomyces sp. NBC_01142]